MVLFALMLETILFLYFFLRTANQPSVVGASSVALASHSFSMEDRYDVTSVNTVFKDNILLTLAYMDNKVTSKNNISWNEVEKPFHAEFSLKPGERFAFDDNMLPDYSDNVVKTMNAHFIWDEGFKSDGYLTGDGVCHLASLIYWAARDAGLSTYAPSNHNFAKINEVPKEYGVAIMSTTPMGNLYIENNKNKPVTFTFDYNGTNLTVSVLEN